MNSEIEKLNLNLDIDNDLDDEIINNHLNNPSNKSKKFMNNLSEFEQAGLNQKIKIKVIGLGGAGNNMINHISKSNIIDNRCLYALNTDYQFLKMLPADNFNKIIIGKNATKGRGSGSNPLIGRQSAIEDIKTIEQILKGTDLLFIVSGMGKGTGTGASPIVARIAKSMGILTLCVVNIPSIKIEGSLIYQKGLNGLSELKKFADGISVISNEKIIHNIEYNNENLTLKKSFEIANDLIANTINEITKTINVAADINIDFNDVKNFFNEPLEFQLDSFIFNEKDNYQAIIRNKIARQMYEREIDNIDKVLINFNLNDKVPQQIITNIKESYANVSNDASFQLLYSVLYNNKIDFANVSILKASKLKANQLNKVNNNLNDITPNNQQEMNQQLNNQLNQLVDNEHLILNNNHSSLISDFKQLQADFKQVNLSITESNHKKEKTNNDEQTEFSSTSLSKFFNQTFKLFNKTKNLKE